MTDAEKDDKLIKLYQFLKKEHIKLTACSCCFGITVECDGHMIASDIEDSDEDIPEQIERQL